MTKTEQMQARLEHLGLTRAAADLTARTALARKLDLAYSHYRFVTQEQITWFNEELRKKTTEKAGASGSPRWQMLQFTPLADYPAAPPVPVLDALEAAIGLGCFDRFEVASIQWHVQVPDPLLFGRITGCDDRFFIAQWDDDVQIEDLLDPDEGFVKPGQEG